MVYFFHADTRVVFLYSNLGMLATMLLVSNLIPKVDLKTTATLLQHLLRIQSPPLKTPLKLELLLLYTHPVQVL